MPVERKLSGTTCGASNLLGQRDASQFKPLLWGQPHQPEFSTPEAATIVISCINWELLSCFFKCLKVPQTSGGEEVPCLGSNRASSLKKP